MDLKQRIESFKRSASGERKYTLDDLMKIREEDNKEYCEKSELERAKVKQEKALGRSGIQPLHQGCTVNNFEADTPEKREAKRFAYDYITSFEDNNGRGFIFSGTPGTGKNHLASAICNALLKSKKSCLVITVNELMQKLRKTYHSDSNLTEDQFIQNMINFDLLVLDEIGLQRGTDAERLAINQIVDQRVNNLKPTGMLTNLSAGEMESTLGARIMDRMKMNGGKWIPFHWESHRK